MNKKFIFTENEGILEVNELVNNEKINELYKKYNTKEYKDIWSFLHTMVDTRNGESSLSVDLKKFLNNTENSINILGTILRTYGREEKLRMINNFWPDFYEFVTNVMNNIDYNEIGQADINDLKAVRDLITSINIKAKEEQIISSAKNNSQIITYAKKINNLK